MDDLNRKSWSMVCSFHTFNTLSILFSSTSNYKTDKSTNVERDIMEFMKFLEKMEYIIIVDDIKLLNISREHCDQLAEILNSDIKLKKAIEDDLIKSPDEFFNEMIKWQTNTNTNVFTIIFNLKPKNCWKEL